MKTFILFVLVTCVYQPVPACADTGLAGRSVIFPKQSGDSYVELIPRRCPNLSAFTVCLRAASEASSNYVLFSYATSHDANELLIWQGNHGRLVLYLGKLEVRFSLPEMNALLRHTCVTWEARSHLVTVWVNGERTLQKRIQKAFVHGGGAIILGQEQDKVRGGFDTVQSFVGEITDVNMWDHALKACEVKTISQGLHCAGGNIISWASVRFIAKGTVHIKNNNDCTGQQIVG
ncbi:C-reactive protein-like [Scyliorhinus torazame]|uniref:C-reactive protein-like n=1 Tax=Scyliorhinus torazame TaxID=75743 RepID=UPI003B5A9585